ncbi:MAG: hypothetical protein AAGF95_34580 [Chloroflexota bacterium]
MTKTRSVDMLVGPDLPLFRARIAMHFLAECGGVAHPKYTLEGVR